ncbi:MAG TPA: co-chaperone GroES [Patescibacteria group bacterium]|nr:co-chaperone GroES [Patescibacteria group bacterium]
MKVQPLFDNVLIEPTEAEERTASGILLPDTAKEKPQTGKVVAVGEGKEKDGKMVPVVVKVGDVVLYKKWGGNEVKLEGKEYTLVSQEDILGIVK